MEAPERRGGDEMLILGLHLVGAVVAWWFLGWRTGLEVLGGYGCCLIGANSPQTFRNSKAALERIANNAAAKAVELAKRGKT